MRGARLRVVSSDLPGQAGLEVELHERGLEIGRGEDCAIALKDPSVSRRHARVEYGPDGYVLVDLESANGILVGERRVERLRLTPGLRFRIGASVFEYDGPVSSPAEVSTTAQTLLGVRPAGDVNGRACRRLEQAGEPVPLGGSRTALLDDSRWAYLLVSGRLEVFTVTVKDGRALGGRSHFVTVNAPSVLFGLEPGSSRGSGFLAVGKASTDLRRLPRGELQRLAREPELRAEVAGLLDGWIVALSARLTREVSPRPETHVACEAGTRFTLAPGQRARSGRGVAWVPLGAEGLLFVGMSPLEAKPGGWFPLTPQTWLEAEGAVPEPWVPRGTAELLGEGALWAGLDHFHEVLCECEFINKRLAVVDEYQRLESKARESEAARDAAYDAIGAVLAGQPGELPATGTRGELSPVLEACRLVGHSLGLEVRAPGEAPAERSFNDHVLAIAAASGFRARLVALRGAWWRSDAGALLGCDGQGAPVALLPRGARSYVCVDVATRARQPLGAARAQSLAPFAYVFYRALPASRLRPWELLRFGARGLGADLWMLVVTGLLLGVLGAMAPLLIGQMVDRAIPQGERGLLFQLGLGLLCVALGGVALRLVKAVALVRVETRMDHALQAALWDRLLELPAAFFRRYGAGDLAERAAGIGAIRGLLSRSGVSAILGALSSLAYVALMFALDPSLALVALGLTFVLVVVTSVGNALLLRTQRREADLHGSLASLVLQLIAGVAKVRVSGAENHAFRVWAQGFSEQKRLSFGLGRLQTLLATVGSGFQVLASLVIFAAIYRLQSGVSGGARLSTGQFVAFYAAFGAFVAAVQSLANASLSLFAVLPVYERLEPILTAEPESDPSRAHPGRLRGGLSVSNVHFRYQADTPWVLQDVSFEIEPGEFVALVGASGCGKSTLLRLLLGFERPGSGTVQYDGQDLAHLDARALRRQLGVVLQESRLLPTDIFRNIVGNSSRTLHEAWEAAEMAGLADDIRQMPMGLHTLVSEGGGTFSGGQRQRLLIARALISKPRLIFFDEATSALDNKAQAVVTQSMDRLDATRIVIAHRLSTAVNADRILYLDGGQIREQGSYQELLARGGLFAQLARRQMA